MPRILALALVALALAVGLTVAGSSTPAAAATKNAGFPTLTPYGGFIGNYLAPDGSRVYCIDSPLPWPSGATSGPALVESVVTTWGAALPAESIQKLNYVLLKYGQTDDATQAAAVAAFVNAYTSGWARDLGAGYEAGAWYLNGNATVIAVYDMIWSDAQANAIVAHTATLAIEMTDAITGTLSVTAPPGATGTVTLAGAARADDGLAEFGVSAGESIALAGRPLDSEREYAITASATFTAPAPAAPNLTLYTTEGQQRTIRGGTTGTSSFGAEASTSAIALDFSPVLSTVVASAEVPLGEAFVDRVTVALAEGSRPWRAGTDGAPVQLIAHGVLYGPFATAPVTADAVPPGAPEAGRETLNLTGPGEYESSRSLRAQEPGFYTWVWRIDAADQDANGAAALPSGYSFVSPFGLPDETHHVSVSPPRLAATGVAPGGAAVVGVGLIVTGVFATLGSRGRGRRGNIDREEVLCLT